MIPQIIVDALVAFDKGNFNWPKKTPFEVEKDRFIACKHCGLLPKIELLNGDKFVIGCDKYSPKNKGCRCAWTYSLYALKRTRKEWNRSQRNSTKNTALYVQGILRNVRLKWPLKLQNEDPLVTNTRNAYVWEEAFYVLADRAQEQVATHKAHAFRLGNVIGEKKNKIHKLQIKVDKLQSELNRANKYIHNLIVEREGR